MSTPAPPVADVLDVVDRVEERARVEDGDDPVSRVGPAALHALALDAGDAPVAPESDPEPHRLLGATAVGDEGLLAARHEAHRATRPAGEEGADELDVEGLGTAPEAAADVGLDHPDPRLLHPQAAREHEVHVVGDLGARVHGEASPLRVVVREGGVHLHLGLADLRAAVGLLAHEVGFGMGRVHVPELVLDVALDVAGALLVEVDGVRGGRVVGRVVRGKLLGLDPDEGERPFRGRVVVGRDGRDRLAPVADPVPGEGVLVHRDREDAEGPVAVRPGHHRPDPGKGLGLARVDRADGRVPPGAAEDPAREGARRGRQVGRVAGPPAHLVGAVDEGDVRPDRPDPRGGRVGPRRGLSRGHRRWSAHAPGRPPAREEAAASAAHRTASTILTYPVQRQMLLPSASRMASSEGSSSRRRSASEAMMSPGVQ